MTSRDLIRMLSVPDARKYLEVVRDADADSAVSGMHYHPYPKSEPFNLEELVEKTEQRWSAGLGQPEWRRAWGWFVDGQMVGSIYLAGRTLSTEMHRVQMGVGLLPTFRGKGGGTRLIMTSVEWARTQEEIEWIDLGVFGDNSPAHALYLKLNFTEVGRVKDRFRIDGAIVDNISMCLYVGTEEPG
jgi:RimJ/RimL family protein N-acetyltransferase